MKKFDYLKILVVVFLISIIIQSSYLIIETSKIEKTALAGKVIQSGTITLGINYPPEILNTTCPDSVRENYETNCQINTYDADGNNVTFLIGQLGQTTSSLKPSKQQQQTGPIILYPDGTITIKSYIDQIGNYGLLLGNYSIHFYPVDNSGMSNSIGKKFEYNLSVYDVNEPPVLSSSIPKQIILKNQDLIILELNDYFADPDYGQKLTYTVSGSSSILISIVASTKVVAYATVCTTETVTFTATDPYGLTVKSNSVEVKVNCETGSGETEAASSSSGSSGDGSSSSAICISNWKCEPWESCTPNGTQKRRCVDKMACDPDNFIYWLYRNCTYVELPDCQEVWRCSDWSACSPDNRQTRSCEELNNCDTQLEKPETTKVCTYIPTCTDSIKNQGETGVDCGGPCLPCPTIETPKAIQEEKTVISSILLLLAFMILSLLLVYKYFHKEINMLAVKTLLTIIEKRNKKIFLSDDNAQELIYKLLILEKSINNANIKKKTMELAVIAREYFSRSMINLKATFEKEQLEKEIVELKIDELLSKIYTSFFDKVKLFETKKQKVYKTDLLIVVEELREIIQLTSNISFEQQSVDKEKEVKELKIDEKDSDILIMKKNIYNTYIAMQFGEIDICKEKYTNIIKLYETFSEDKKGLFYDDIARLFNEIKYFVSINE
ncbi:MAG: hypothetical protein KJ583_00995 [Nanoarchaeota archaeon]|nr:hypothetical protein [Nanoarchaeota archaeon]MBU1270489.1 hypothetical protein [Nanoarchaeota archaeon]MBU1603867.1 hypothetical protein [Nanoarchaeota archaeon]MBU2442718.1 hypothetical protein [Nanoarchaeota archaeon]